MKLLKSESGMTLTETIVAMALVAIAAIIITTSVAAAQILIRSGVDAEAAIADVVSAVETGANSGTAELQTVPDGSVTFDVGLESFTVQGTYRAGAADLFGITSFTPETGEATP